MPRFSAFWLTHYKEIGNCCMTAPLKKLKVLNNVKVEVPDKFQSLQLVEDYIDTGWMDQKQLKWIGWDIQGWYAWTDPNGMLYRIKDLQRNEDGREYEKEVEEIVASGDPRTHQGNPTAKELYTFERDMQRNCGFCPDGSGGSDGSDAEQEGGKKDDTKKENIADDIDLDKLMQGDITDFMPGDKGVTYVPEMREYAPIIDTTEITETGHITADIFGTFGGDSYTPGIDEYGAGNVDDGGGIVKEIIDDLPILPPKPMPTGVVHPAKPKSVTDFSIVTALQFPSIVPPPRQVPAAVTTHLPVPTYQPPVFKPLQDTIPKIPPIKPAPKQNPPAAAKPVNIPENIKFGANADKSVLSQKTINILQDVMKKTGNPSIIITSTQRSPHDQARVMLDNIINDGVEMNLQLYGSNGDKVVRLAKEAIDNGESRKDIIKKMEQLINHLGPQKVSVHTADPSKINVIDISPNSLSNMQLFIQILQSLGFRVLFPPNDKAVHVEIPQ